MSTFESLRQAARLQAAQAESQLSSEYESSSSSIRTFHSNLERDYQSLIGGARKQQSLATKRRAARLPRVKAPDTKELEAKYRTSSAELQAARRELESALEAGKLDIARQLSTAIQDIDTAEKKFKAENIQLRNGEWVNREAYNNLDPEAKEVLQEGGVEGLKSWNLQREEEFKSKNIEVKPGVWVSKADWIKLTPEQKEEFKQTGTYTVVSQPTEESALKQFRDMQESGEIPSSATYTGLVDGQITYQVQPTETEAIAEFNKLKKEGKIPSNAVFLGFEDGQLQYEVPVTESDAKSEFEKLKEAGEIPQNAVFLGFSNGNIEYEIPVDSTSAKTEFEKLQEVGEIPSNATYVGFENGQILYEVPSEEPQRTVDPRFLAKISALEDPTLSYEPSPSWGITAQPDFGDDFYLVPTPSGSVKIPAASWESMTSIERATLQLGRTPTLNELYSLNQVSAGASYVTGTGLSGLFAGFYNQFRLGTELLIPGIQSPQEEQWWEQQPLRTSLKEEYTSTMYPIEKVESTPLLEIASRAKYLLPFGFLIPISSSKEELSFWTRTAVALEEFGLPALIRPASSLVDIKDITAQEWKQTGLTLGVLYGSLAAGKAASYLTQKVFTTPTVIRLLPSKLRSTSQKAILATEFEAPRMVPGMAGYRGSVTGPVRPYYTYGKQQGAQFIGGPTVEVVPMTGATFRNLWFGPPEVPFQPSYTPTATAFITPSSNLWFELSSRVGPSFRNSQILGARYLGGLVTLTGVSAAATTTKEEELGVGFAEPLREIRTRDLSPEERQSLGTMTSEQRARLYPDSEEITWAVSPSIKLSPGPSTTSRAVGLPQSTPTTVGVVTRSPSQAAIVSPLISSPITSIEPRPIAGTDVATTTATTAASTTSPVIKPIEVPGPRSLSPRPTTVSRPSVTTGTRPLTRILTVPSTGYSSLPVTGRLNSLEASTVTQLQQLSSIQTRTLTSTAFSTIPPAGTSARAHLPPAFPSPPEEVEEVKPELEDLPEGTVMWQQGFIQKVIPPPYSGIKPFSNFNPVPKGEGSPYATFTILGEPTIQGEVDLGVVDVSFKDDIKFRGGGLRTDVGKRDPSRTRGMTVRRRAEFREVRRF